jgi:hypothetical protein
MIVPLLRGVFHKKTVEADAPKQMAAGFGLKTRNLIADPIKIGFDIPLLDGMKKIHERSIQVSKLTIGF